VEPLDNPIWHALTGPHASFVEGSGLALRYRTDVAPFGALPDAASPEAWDALAELVGPGGGAVLFRDEAFEPPAGWSKPMALPTLQMIASDGCGRADADLVVLGDDDVDDMLALVELAKPGPFLPRTIELGGYLGLRECGRLVAMAGERLHPPGYGEISAVCTDPDARKRGLATRLVRAVAAGIEARDETAMLHVLATNHSAIRVYEALGFTVRTQFQAAFVMAPK
jgi:ribosomal protein S18 acetylase RimI-like enzyme